MHNTDILQDQDSPVVFTKRAHKKLLRLVEKEQNAEKTLRIGVKGGGCSGMTYILDFDMPQENDHRFEIDGLQFIIDLGHMMYLSGMTLDYPDGLDARGFIFENPNAAQTCGCGTSFNTGA